MRIIILLFALTCFAAAQADEEVVTILPGVEGRLLMPNTRGAPDRGVLILHGWNDHMDGVGDLQKQLARELLYHNIASLRFNFSGEGQRTGYVVTMTHDSRMREATAAYELLKNRLNNPKIGIQGFSLGGLTAMSLAGDNPDWFVSMVLWSAAEAMRFEGDPAFNITLQTAMRDGQAVLNDWTDITVTDKFLGSFLGVNASDNLHRFEGSFLTIRGDQDYLPSHDRRWLKQLPTKDKSFHLIGGADHIFSVLEEPKPAYGDRVVDLTADWFASRFKALPRD